MRIKNFGGNVVYEPKAYYEPKTEQEVLDILEKHKDGHVRVRSIGHSWSEIVEADDAMIRMTHFTSIAVEECEGEAVARIGAGATLQYILDTLHSTSHYTLPTLGGIKRQTIAGATATATHGTGSASLSSYVRAVKIACYDAAGKSCIKRITDGEELLAARASLGCTGVVLEITIAIVPKFWMEEESVQCESLASIIKNEKEWPQQQFFVFPYSWRWYAYRRRKIAEPTTAQKRAMRWHRLYDEVVVEWGLHALVKVVEWLSIVFGRGVMTACWRYVIPPLMRETTVQGDSETILTLHTAHHYRFRHIEMELFIPREHLESAVSFMRAAIPFFAGEIADVDPVVEQELQYIGMFDDFKSLHGTYAHHYPLFFRHILSEETLLAMNQGEERYSMSVFTFVPPAQQQAYYDVCTFLACTFARLYRARPHWGKYNPLSQNELVPLYPHMDRFREICHAHDPQGVFQNVYTKRVGVGTV